MLISARLVYNGADIGDIVAVNAYPFFFPQKKLVILSVNFFHERICLGVFRNDSLMECRYILQLFTPLGWLGTSN